ncbi:MAG TPA: class I SAM-dependent methyltransferase [Pirellulales bacterium]|nr:class I SAM-dependent methyltransferase [Pirellulales bacterium]
MTEERFEFGRNWEQFLTTLDDGQIRAATLSLESTLGANGLAGKSFLDVGCGSGLFSLAARKLGASVRSFDFDPRSVECARRLKERYFPYDDHWQIEAGSVLDGGLLASLGKFDVVYAWGVLHHTGAMRRAWESVASLVSHGGRLCISIYNDQGYVSQVWLMIKRTYQRLPRWMRPGLVAAVAGGLFARRLTISLAASGLRLCSLRNPLTPWINWLRESRGRRQRGMHRWYDLIDWVGGYPFEVARPEEVFNFFRSRGFELIYLTTQGGGHGCNEFVFRRVEAAGGPTASGGLSSP